MYRINNILLYPILKCAWTRKHLWNGINNTFNDRTSSSCTEWTGMCCNSGLASQYNSFNGRDANWKIHKYMLYLSIHIGVNANKAYNNNLTIFSQGKPMLLK